MEKALVVSYIIRLVSDAQPNPISGAQLSARVKAAFPDFSTNVILFGCRNLREFIKNHVPEIAEGGKAGMDVIYVLRAQQVEMFGAAVGSPPLTPDHLSPLGQLLGNPRIWKTFTSPETVYRLYVLPSGIIRVCRQDESPDPSWPQIQSISAEALLNIAKDFISGLPENQQEILTRTLDQTRWWFPYFDLLSTLGLKTRWIIFRRRRVAEEFEKAFSKASLPLPLSILQKPPEVHSSRSGENPNIPDSMLRRIAVSAVQRMTDSELRALNLPLGYVIDAMMVK